MNDEMVLGALLVGAGCGLLPLLTGLGTKKAGLGRIWPDMLRNRWPSCGHYWSATDSNCFNNYNRYEQVLE